MASRTAHVAVGVSSFPSGVIVEVNEAFCRLFQRPRDQIVGRTAVDLGLWVDAQQRQRLVEGAQQPNGIAGFEARYHNASGESGDLEVSARVVSQGDQRYLISFLTEVTREREFVEGLRVVQARLGVVMRATGLLVMRQDHDLRYTWVANPALGATEEDLLGRTDEEIMGAEAAAPLSAIKRRVLESGRAERRDVWVANKGHLGCFDLVVEPECDAGGRVVGILCAAQDITRRMVDEPRARLAAPVKAIRGMASLIGREALTRRQAERLLRIDIEVGRLAGPGRAAPALQQLRDRHAGVLVLVAEHNPVLGELVRALLEDAGLRVALADNGVEAFSFALQLSPALLLLDMEMPQSGGVAAARAVRAMLPRTLPIVAMLSALPPPMAVRALDADLDDVLDKPVPAQRLYEKVLAWLDAR